MKKMGDSVKFRISLIHQFGGGDVVVKIFLMVVKIIGVILYS